MATLKAVSRLSSRFQPLALKLVKPSLSLELTSQSRLSVSARRINRISRSPAELSSLASMMPFYSAVASARLVSSLSMESKSWGLVPQGISMPL